MASAIEHSMASYQLADSMKHLREFSGLFISLLTIGPMTPGGIAAREITQNRHPVKAVGDVRIEVGHSAVLPLYVSRDWSKPVPEITRAILVLHGRQRNADTYFRSALKAQDAGVGVGQASLVIAPQFLAPVDIEAHHLSGETLRWTREGWEDGDAALAPAPTSSFEALDAILRHLADQRLFPNLKQVVIVGHSGGAQIVQRYAIAGHGEEVLTQEGVSMRYVVANPSSYAYFGTTRPEPQIAFSC